MDSCQTFKKLKALSTYNRVNVHERVRELGLHVNERTEPSVQFELNGELVRDAHRALDGLQALERDEPPELAHASRYTLVFLPRMEQADQLH